MAKKDTKTTETTTHVIVRKPTKYQKLLKVEKYDHDIVDELVEALNEITLLEAQVAQLKTLIEDNQELHKFVWKTSEGETLALHNIEDDHLIKIMKHLLKTGRAVSRSIRSEAMSRGLEIPKFGSVSMDDDAEWARAKRLMFGDRADVL